MFEMLVDRGAAFGFVGGQAAAVDGSTIAPAFLLNRKGKPYTAESIGNLFRDAAGQAGMSARLHGLRKAFCVY